jgi:NADH-quinone oxidoreductase subunit L
MSLLEEHPGLIYVVATLLPMAAVVLLLILGGVRNFLRAQASGSPAAGSLYEMLGGDYPGKGAAYIATGAIGLSFICCLIGFFQFTGEIHDVEHSIHDLRHDIDRLMHKKDDEKDQAKLAQLDRDIELTRKKLEAKEGRWDSRIEWAGVHPAQLKDSEHGTSLQLGYHIDHLSAAMFLMVTFIATLIHLFSIGYMADELREVQDHEVHTEHGHLHRRGRFGRFFLFLSLFCFSMLNLVLADNLFQIFISWELVGLCSYLLIGFYFERTSASNAANKAFITNRIGDAGFILGMLIIWTYMGTFNFKEIFARVRCPDQAESLEHEHKHETLAYAGMIVRGEIKNDDPQAGKKVIKIASPDAPLTLSTQAILFPRRQEGDFHGVGPGGHREVETFARPEPEQYSSMPYWLLVAAGLGVFLGCVGKSAQFPLHVWLPDAMEGPTPVSALIHAATMVAAGVYLVGRTFPLFTPEAQLAIAYTGAITLTVAATIAVVMTDIKKVLAYSTVSQLGYMMLALGVGGWVAGLFHLITHAFFKALLFLGSGSVIYGCHHQQEMGKMGGLFPKMKITALTMLVGVLAISGIPLFSGWYSKDAILAQAYGFGMVHGEHFLLFLLPLLTAGVTAFYMFRMWFLTFTGKPRDEHVHEHAHESPRVMTVPLIVLAFFSVVVAWGWPVWDPEASALDHFLHHTMPTSVMADFGLVVAEDQEHGSNKLIWTPGMVQDIALNTRHQAHEAHSFVGLMALGVVAIGIIFAYLLYYRRVLDPAEAQEQFPGVYAFLSGKWYFDELYSVLLVRPALAVAGWFRFFDSKVIDGVIDGSARVAVRTSWWSGRFDYNIVDGLVNLAARVCQGIGNWLRVVQTGYIRSYVLFLVLAAIASWLLLMFLLGSPPAAGAP